MTASHLKIDDKEELGSLSDEIACRLVEKYDDEFVESKWDDKRAELIHKYLMQSEKILKNSREDQRLRHRERAREWRQQ